MKAPVVILDDAAFTEYCRQIGVAPRLDGTIILNRIWDSLHSNFRYPKYVPFVGEKRESVFLQDAESEEEKTEVPVTAYTQEMPALREEYEDYALVQFMPLSLWVKVSGQIGGAESDTYVRILAGENASLKALDKIEKEVLHLLAPNYKTEIENRIQEKITNDEIIFRISTDSGRVLCHPCSDRNRKCILQHTGVSAPEKTGISTVYVCGHDNGRHSKDVLYRSPGHCRQTASDYITSYCGFHGIHD